MKHLRTTRFVLNIEELNDIVFIINRL